MLLNYFFATLIADIWLLRVLLLSPLFLAASIMVQRIIQDALALATGDGLGAAPAGDFAERLESGGGGGMLTSISAIDDLGYGIATPSNLGVMNHLQETSSSPFGDAKLSQLHLSKQQKGRGGKDVGEPGSLSPELPFDSQYNQSPMEASTVTDAPASVRKIGENQKANNREFSLSKNDDVSSVTRDNQRLNSFLHEAASLTPLMNEGIGSTHEDTEESRRRQPEHRVEQPSRTAQTTFPVGGQGEIQFRTSPFGAAASGGEDKAEQT